MKTLITNNTAANAMEAKVIVDSFLLSLTDEQCAKLAFSSIDNDVINKMPLTISYAIGSGSFYYGPECKIFCSDKIANVVFNKAFKHIDYIKSQQNG